MRRLIFLLISILLITTTAACQKKEEPVVGMTFTPTRTAVIPTITSQPSTTPRPIATTRPSPTPSLTPSITPTPQPTSTPTITPLPAAYLTPSTPAAAPSQYHLVPWTADHADNLGRLMEKLSRENRKHFDNYQQEGWHRQTYTYPVVAYGEALFRYSEDPRTYNWRIKKIFNEAESGQADYEGLLSLIVETLNDHDVPLENATLSDWFNSYPSIFDIQLITLEPLPGYLSSSIIDIYSTYEIGGFTALILENEGGFTGQMIFSSLGDYAALTHDVDSGDLTGDGWSEVIISFHYQSGTIVSNGVGVYDLSQGVPKELKIGGGSWTNFYVNSAMILTDSSGAAYLHLEGGHPAFCPLAYESDYVWNGLWFEQSRYAPILGSFDFCYFTFVTYQASGFSIFERMELLSRFETSFSSRKPTGPSIIDGEPYPPDTLDEIRFTIAMNHAAFGHVTEAKEFLQLIFDNPTIPESNWLEPAQLFLNNYDDESDVYRACWAAGNCNTYLSLKRVISTLSISDFDDIIGRLSDLGATVHNSGSFDFDEDGTAETWAVLSGLPGGPLELWLFAETAEAIAAEFIADTTTLYPTFNYYTSPEGSTLNDLFWNVPPYDTTTFTTGTGDVFSFVRHPTTGEPFVDLLEPPLPPYSPPPPDPLVIEFETAVSDLFAGADPAEVAERISAVVNNPAFTPRNRHYYYLGLAYELAGDEPNAVAAYLLAWQDCCDEYTFGPEGFTIINPYALMAQAKLELDN